MRLRRELKSERVERFSRRGDLSAIELVSLVIIVLVGFFVIYWFFNIRDVIYGVEDGACAAQVRAAAQVGKVFGRDYNVSTPACQTKYVTIRRNELPRDNDAARDRVRYLLAEEMRTCWDQWGRGELDLFAGPDTYCSFCANIAFDEGTKSLFSDSKGRVDGFGTYLQETPAPGKDMSYNEYFIGTTIDPVGVPSDQRNFLLDTADNLTVVFYYEKSLTQSSAWQQFLSWTSGRDVGAWEASDRAVETIVGTAVGAGAVGGVVKGVGTVAGGSSIGAGIGAGIGTTMRTLAGFARRIVMNPVKSVAGATGITTLMYARMRALEEYGVISAIYITELAPNNVYVQSCGTQAEPTRSP